MKKLILSSVCFLSIISFVAAQDDEKNEEKGFKKENLFTGGSVTASFFSGGTVLGASPMFGYQLKKWIDAGVAFNYTYTGRRDYIYFNDKVRQHVYGPGLFTRIFPVRMIFLQAQYEHNFTTFNYYDPNNIKSAFKYDANSFLVGAGLAEGREPGSNTFFYISLLFDVIKNANSPYVNNIYDQNTGQLLRTDVLPIVRAGVNIGLFQGKNNNGGERRNGRKRPRERWG